MKPSREAVLTDVLQLLHTMADDWEYSGEITPATYLLGDLGLQSLDIVILANTVQEHYGQTLPFTEFFAAVGEREVHDISVGEWADFIASHLADVPEPQVEASRS